MARWLAIFVALWGLFEFVAWIVRDIQDDRRYWKEHGQ